MLKITSRATSANVGAGFDCLGICFQKENIYEFDKASGIVLNGSRNAEKIKSNLTIKALYSACDTLGTRRPTDFSLNIRTGIPLSRGLGSSAACITAGVAAAYWFAGREPDPKDLLTMSALLEGHPDNVAANIFGGGVLSYKVQDRYDSMNFPVSDRLAFVALIPAAKLPTKKARRLLPSSLSYADAVHNMTRTALTVNALSRGDGELLRIAVDDRMHEPHRRPLIAGYSEAVKTATDAGAYAVYLSGAGPSLMAICPKKQANQVRKAFGSDLSIWHPEVLRVSRAGLEWEETGKA